MDLVRKLVYQPKTMFLLFDLGLQIPFDGKERMETFPPFGSQDFTIKGIGWDTSAADVVLSSVGWVSVTAGSGSLVTLKAHTPNAVGLHIRQPALLPTSVQRRGE